MFEPMRINMDEVREPRSDSLAKDLHREKLHKLVGPLALRLVALALHGISKEKAASKNHRLFLIEKEKDEFLDMLHEEIRQLEKKAHLIGPPE